MTLRKILTIIKTKVFVINAVIFAVCISTVVTLSTIRLNANVSPDTNINVYDETGATTDTLPTPSKLKCEKCVTKTTDIYEHYWQIFTNDKNWTQIYGEWKTSHDIIRITFIKEPYKSSLLPTESGLAFVSNVEDINLDGIPDKPGQGAFEAKVEYMGQSVIITFAATLPEPGTDTQPDSTQPQPEPDADTQPDDGTQTQPQPDTQPDSTQPQPGTQPGTDTQTQPQPDTGTQPQPGEPYLKTTFCGDYWTVAVFNGDKEILPWDKMDKSLLHFAFDRVSDNTVFYGNLKVANDKIVFVGNDKYYHINGLYINYAGSFIATVIYANTIYGTIEYGEFISNGLNATYINAINEYKHYWQFNIFENDHIIKSWNEIYTEWQKGECELAWEITPFEFLDGNDNATDSPYFDGNLLPTRDGLAFVSKQNKYEPGSGSFTATITYHNGTTTAGAVICCV
jgi:hypothetical protein